MCKIVTSLAALLVLAVSGCAPQVDVEAERAAISDMPIEWSKAAEAKDVERMVALYSDDASVLPRIAAEEDRLQMLSFDMQNSKEVCTSTTAVDLHRGWDWWGLAGVSGNWRVRLARSGTYARLWHGFCLHSI